jgi:hypothetical protein
MAHIAGSWEVVLVVRSDGHMAPTCGRWCACRSP